MPSFSKPSSLVGKTDSESAKMGDASMPKSLKDSLDATKVSYAQLGKSGLRVSVPILGAMVGS